MAIHSPDHVSNDWHSLRLNQWRNIWHNDATSDTMTQHLTQRRHMWHNDVTSDTSVRLQYWLREQNFLSILFYYLKLVCFCWGTDMGTGFNPFLGQYGPHTCYHSNTDRPANFITVINSWLQKCLTGLVRAHKHESWPYIIFIKAYDRDDDKVLEYDSSLLTNLTMEISST